mgnify:CR=1 FL=1
MVTKRKKLSNAEVTEFLVLNPDFFKDNPEVLNSIEIIHESGGAVSLIQRQIELLRSDYKSTTNRLLEILGVAKSNENIFSLTKKLILSLIETSSLEEMVLILEKGFESDFGAKKSRLLFFTEFSKDLPKGRIRNPSEATRILGNLLKPGAVYCGEMNKGVSSFIFGNKPKIKESALCRIFPTSVVLSVIHIIPWFKLILAVTVPLKFIAPFKLNVSPPIESKTVLPVITI